MKREEIYKKIRDIMQATFRGNINIDSIDEHTNLIEEVGLNSIVGIEILVRIENEFDIEIDDDDLSVELLTSLDTIAAYIESKQVA